MYAAHKDNIALSNSTYLTTPEGTIIRHYWSTLSSDQRNVIMQDAAAKVFMNEFRSGSPARLCSPAAVSRLSQAVRLQGMGLCAKGAAQLTAAVSVGGVSVQPAVVCGPAQGGPEQDDFRPQHSSSSSWQRCCSVSRPVSKVSSLSLLSCLGEHTGRSIVSHAVLGGVACMQQHSPVVLSLPAAAQHTPCSNKLAVIRHSLAERLRGMASTGMSKQQPKPDASQRKIQSFFKRSTAADAGQASYLAE